MYILLPKGRGFTDKEQYKKYAEKKSPPSPIFKNCTFAFIIGGLICVLGQGFTDMYKYFGLDKETAGTATSITLIFIGALLTGLNIYPKIAKFAGAGTIVPITGFSNAVTSPAIEAKSEGFILGVGAKIFTIAGPVIVYGVFASMLAGMVYLIIN